MLSENGVNAPFIINAPGIVPEGITSDALIDFSDLLPTLCDLAQTSPDKEYEYDGISFAPEIYGLENKSKRDWIMALGSNPAKIKNGRIKNAFDFRDRIVRDKNFKAYIDTLNKIYEIIELKSDFYEENNLLNSKDKILKNSKILILGVAYKKDISDMRESPAVDIANLLLEKNVDVSFYDPYVNEFLVSGNKINKEEDIISFNNYDMLLILTPHSKFSEIDFSKIETITFDTTGSDFIVSTERI